MQSIGYLGPHGTYSEKAAEKYRANNPIDLVPCPTIDAVFENLDKGIVTQVVVPLENSYEGTVVRVLDLLARYRDFIVQGEVVIHVCHHLLGHPGTKLEQIKSVLSHPQALAQCSGFLAKELPNVKLQEVESTARAAAVISECGPGLAAIGNDEAGQRYKLIKLASNIQDMTENYTRFLVVGRTGGAVQGVEWFEKGKISLILSIADKPGALYEVLRQFATKKINLTKIESRPARTKLGEYIFFIDLDGHINEPAIKEALEVIKGNCLDFRLLGCYPGAGKD